MQRRMGCPMCEGGGAYDDVQNRFFCFDCGFDSGYDDVHLTEEPADIRIDEQELRKVN